MKCGYPLPCPWHTAIIEEGAPRVFIPKESGLNQGQRKLIRILSVEINDALEE
jgi:hypothetical protein